MSRCPFAWLSGPYASVAQMIVFAIVLYRLCFYLVSPSEKWMDATVLKKLQTSHPVAVFAPGVGAAFHQSAKYAGKEGVLTATAATRTRIPNAPALLYNVHPSDGLGDVAYFEPGTLNYYATLPLRVPFMLADYSYGMQNPPSWLHLWYRVDLAGEETVKKYVLQVEECAKQNPSKRLVLFGTSNGASTVLASLPELSEELSDRIALVVLEAPYDTVSHITHRRFGLGKTFTDHVLPWLTRYDPRQRTPLDAIESISDKIPVAFITIKNDTHVYNECTETLIKALKKKRRHMGNNPMIHKLHLTRGAGHCDASIHNEEDAIAYKEFMDALYTEYLRIQNK